MRALDPHTRSGNPHIHASDPHTRSGVRMIYLFMTSRRHSLYASTIDILDASQSRFSSQCVLSTLVFFGYAMAPRNTRTRKSLTLETKLDVIRRKESGQKNCNTVFVVLWGFLNRQCVPFFQKRMKS